MSKMLPEGEEEMEKVTWILWGLAILSVLFYSVIGCGIYKLIKFI